MPDYRVEFPDDAVWTITVKHKKGRTAVDTLRMAHRRAVGARAAKGTTGGESFEDCTVQKITAKVRAELKGLTYLTAAELLATANRIGAEYQRRDLGLTVRGMYYQLVSRGLLPSGQSEYNRVKKGLADARFRGDFPLGLLSDSSRTLHIGDEVSGFPGIGTDSNLVPTISL